LKRQAAAALGNESADYADFTDRKNWEGKCPMGGSGSLPKQKLLYFYLRNLRNLRIFFRLGNDSL
jgi:hypothetical protein